VAQVLAAASRSDFAMAPSLATTLRQVTRATGPSGRPLVAERRTAYWLNRELIDTWAAQVCSGTDATRWVQAATTAYAGPG
jgi:hypothetical protein